MHGLLNTSANFYKPEVIGTKLQRKLPKMTRTARALLGAELMAGPMQFSARQASRFAEVEMKYIRAARKATPGEFWCLQHGYLTIEDVHARHLGARRTSDAVIDKRVSRIGLEQVLASCDRLTAPANGAMVRINNTHGNGHANA
jgi:hypothetical protein